MSKYVSNEVKELLSELKQVKQYMRECKERGYEVPRSKIDKKNKLIQRIKTKIK